MDRHLFIGYCWGAAGTAWLARLLNSHEDIFCVHAPILERFNHFNFDDSILLIDRLFNSMSFGGGYPIAGLTHGVPLSWHERLVEQFEDRLRNFILTRHPIPRIQSSAAKIASNFQKWGQDSRQVGEYRKTYDELIKRSEIPFPEDYNSLGFYNSCVMTNSIIKEIDQAFPIVKMEDLISQEREVQRLTSYLSDGTVQLDPRVIIKLQQTFVNRRSMQIYSPSEIYAEWSDDYRRAYHYLVEPASIEIYSRLGYDFPEGTKIL